MQIIQFHHKSKKRWLICHPLLEEKTSSFLSLYLISLLYVLTACTVESYESGDGKYSYMKAEMAMLHCIESHKIDYAITDQGEKIIFTQPFICYWAKHTNAIYRAMLYYQKTDKQVKGIKCHPVWLCEPKEKKHKMPTDPVKLSGIWLSSNKKFINLNIGLLTGGKANHKEEQVLTIVIRHIQTDKHGNHIYDLELIHAQNNMAQMYTSTFYISIPTDKYNKRDTIRIKVNTYEGEVEKDFSF